MTNRVRKFFEGFGLVSPLKKEPTYMELINIPKVEFMVRTAYRSGLYRDGVNQLINVWKGIPTSERQRSIDSKDKEVGTGM